MIYDSNLPGKRASSEQFRSKTGILILGSDNDNRENLFGSTKLARIPQKRMSHASLRSPFWRMLTMAGRKNASKPGHFRECTIWNYLDSANRWLAGGTSSDKLRL